MAEIHDATLTPGKLELLASWLPRQRWYAAKGATPRLTRLLGFRLDDPAGEVGVETIVVRDDASEPPLVYQVPLTYRGEPLASADHALVGTMEHSVLGRRWVYDAPHDPLYAPLLWGFMHGRASAQSSSASDTAEPAFVGYAAGAPRAVTSSTVLRGEQSNTSIICQVDGDEGVIIKVVRALSPGANPDVTLGEALHAVGNRSVPQVRGHVEGPVAPGSGPDATGTLAIAATFFPGARDAWRVTLEALQAGDTDPARIRALGVATATVHRDLARALPTATASAGERARLTASFAERAEAAFEAAPELAAYAGLLRQVRQAALDGAWPTLQRVHGDYHLGQVIDAPGRGWILLDFEGEPLRPLAERNAPDLALRDVAGMLRSLDYAAATHERTSGVFARSWLAEARTAFLDGYAASGEDPRASAPLLLLALEIDKALYEVVYEARNRPDWLAIPLEAVHRLVAQFRRLAAVGNEAPSPEIQPRHHRSAEEAAP